MSFAVDSSNIDDSSNVGEGWGLDDLIELVEYRLGVNHSIGIPMLEALISWWDEQSISASVEAVASGEELIQRATGLPFYIKDNSGSIQFVRIFPKGFQRYLYEFQIHNTSFPVVGFYGFVLRPIEKLRKMKPFKFDKNQDRFHFHRICLLISQRYPNHEVWLTEITRVDVERGIPFGLELVEDEEQVRKWFP